MIITKETPCLLCRRMIDKGRMVLLSNGFICENCCLEIASSEIVIIEVKREEI